MSEQSQQWEQQWAQVVAKACSDEAFRKRLLAQPAAALTEVGVAMPEGKQLKVVENTDQLVYLVLPAKADVELSEDELAIVAGGFALNFKDL